MLVVETSGPEADADDAWVGLEDSAEDRARIATALSPLLEKYSEPSAPESAAAEGGSTPATVAPAPRTDHEAAPRTDHEAAPAVADAPPPDVAMDRPHQARRRVPSST